MILGNPMSTRIGSFVGHFKDRLVRAISANENVLDQLSYYFDRNEFEIMKTIGKQS